MSVDQDIANLKSLIETTARRKRNVEAYTEASRLMRAAAEVLLSADQDDAIGLARQHLSAAIQALLLHGTERLDEDA